MATNDQLERKLTVIFSADVKGYSRLMAEDEVATIQMLTAYRGLMTSSIQKHRGQVIDMPGDNLLAEFGSVLAALSCAVEVQRELAKRNAALPDQRKMEFRIGINLGDVVVEGDRIFGDGVNVAARLEGLAEPGGICISGAVHSAAGKKLALAYKDLGKQQVKNIAEPVRVYRVLLDPDASSMKARRFNRRHIAASAAVFVITVGIAISTWLQPWKPKEELTPEKPTAVLPAEAPSIAVLPFQNLSDDPKQEYFSDGVTNDIITDLSRFSNLFVIASNSVFTYKGKPVNVKEVGRDLDVRYVLEGSIQKVEGSVRINAQLIDAANNHHLWAERYDFKLDNIFAVQDKITKSIVAALQVMLTEDEQERVARRYTDVLEAYDLFLRGRTYLQGTKQTHLKARKLFDQAIELDPNFAAAYAEKSFTYFSSFIMPMSRNKKVIKAAIKAAEHAVALDDSLPLAHARLGWAYFASRRHQEAIAEGRRAVALGPNDAESHAQLGSLMNWTGKPEEGIVLIKKAMRLNPNYPYYYLFYMGHSHYLLGNNEEAIALMKRVVTRAPYFLPVRRHLAVLFQEIGLKKEARTQVKEVLRIFPGASIEDERQRCYYKWEPALQKRFFTGLRQSGMPEGRRGEEPMTMD
ncbi:MAG: tetratricopeptide repeat protein [Deltaproteobacteria bacterium]|nr:MAG: tetratricopeptide repeat protein [Deltaproteobacteria bacterium]